MKKKQKSKLFGFYVRRPYEPLKMTIAVSMAAGTTLVLLGVVFFWY